MANEVESNNSRPDANEIVFNETVTGNISEPGEQGYFKINFSRNIELIMINPGIKNKKFLSS